MEKTVKIYHQDARGFDEIVIEFENGAIIYLSPGCDIYDDFYNELTNN